MRASRSARRIFRLTSDLTLICPFSHTCAEKGMIRASNSSGGVIAFHDAVASDFPGVAQVIGQALATGDWAIGGQARSLFWIFRRQGGRS